MKKIIFILLCLSSIGISQICKGQNPNANIDSLLNALKTAKEDTNKVELIISIAMYNINSESQIFLKYAYQSLALSEKLKFDRGKVQSLNAISAYHNFGGRFDSALYYLNIAKELIEKSGNKKWLMTLLANVGNNYDSKGDLAMGSEYQLKALKLSEELKDTFAIATLAGNIAVNYELQGDYTLAITFNLKSLKLRETIYDSTGIARTCLAIGNVYSHLKDYNNALPYLFRALIVCEAINDIHDASSCNLSIGGIYIEKGKADEALTYFNKALEQSIEVKDLWLEGTIYGGFGKAYFETGNLDKALFYHSKSLKLMNETGDKVRQAEQNEEIGNVYYKKKNYHASIEFLQKGLSIAIETGTKGVQTETYKTLTDVYSEMKNYKLALDNYILYTQLNDSIHNVESIKKITEMQGKYNVDKKEKEIAFLTKDKEIQNIEIKKQKLQKYSFVGGLGLVIILLLFGYRTYRIRQTLRLQSIRNKISGDLHDDIGSTLNSISIYSEVARKKDEQQDEALEMIGEASRKIIDAMSDIVWTVNPDNDSFAKIIFRMKSFAYNLFRAKKIEFTFHAEETLNEKKLSLEERRNFYLIFKEAVNNLVKYSNATRAAITLTSENDYIKLRIQDDGAGFDMTQDTAGNGLKNMKRRADEMKAQFNIESSKGNGTVIELKLKA